MMNQTTHLSLYGTAVQVVPEAEYQAEIEKKRKENEAQLEAQRKKLEAHQSLMLDLEAKRMRGEATPADQFIAEIRNIDSMMEVWKIWQGYGFDESYPGSVDFPTLPGFLFLAKVPVFSGLHSAISIFALLPWSGRIARFD